MANDIPFHVSEVPDIEARGDCIYINWRGMEFYVPIPIAQAGMGRLSRALDEWYFDQGLVVPFRPTTIAAE
jgi:hypothetical protein